MPSFFISGGTLKLFLWWFTRLTIVMAQFLYVLCSKLETVVFDGKLKQRQAKAPQSGLDPKFPQLFQRADNDALFYFIGFIDRSNNMGGCRLDGFNQTIKPA